MQKKYKELELSQENQKKSAFEERISSMSIEITRLHTTIKDKFINYVH